MACLAVAMAWHGVAAGVAAAGGRRRQMRGGKWHRVAPRHAAWRSAPARDARGSGAWRGANSGGMLNVVNQRRWQRRAALSVWRAPPKISA
jgi:hypothetical protein